MSTHDQVRAEVCTYARLMHSEGMVVGTAGNVSARVPDEELIAITPSSLPYEEMTPADIVLVDFEGNTTTEGRPPSFEKVLHIAVYRARGDINAVLHTHSTYCSVLALLHKPLPPMLEELVPYVGGQVDVAAYAMSGSDELAANVIEALGEKAAALLANHGNSLLRHDSPASHEGGAADRALRTDIRDRARAWRTQTACRGGHRA